MENINDVHRKETTSRGLVGMSGSEVVQPAVARDSTAM